MGEGTVTDYSRGASSCPRNGLRLSVAGGTPFELTFGHRPDSAPAFAEGNIVADDLHEARANGPPAGCHYSSSMRFRATAARSRTSSGTSTTLVMRSRARLTELRVVNLMDEQTLPGK